MKTNSLITLEKSVKFTVRNLKEQQGVSAHNMAMSVSCCCCCTAASLIKPIK